MKYRPEIDGLRAVAVIPVMLFHAGFHTFSGGFIGVDVFFVISGYLITSLILTEKRNGTFSLTRFYERRARRILPALFVVVLACLPAAYLLLAPRDLKQFSQSVVAVVGFSSNAFFFLKSGYFDSSAELQPLLHTWSLAVEEQYYLLFPVLLWVGWKFRKSVIVGTLVLICVLSLAAAEWGSRHDPRAAFFLLPMRAWELGIGALVGFYLLDRTAQRQTGSASQWLGGCGLGLIIFGVVAFDQNIPFPSLYALVPTFGTALVILFGTAETAVGRILGNRVPIQIGLVSYSAYLWHQPLLAFARYRSVREPSSQLLLTLLAVSLLLAYFTWAWVERPFRTTHRVGPKQLWTFASASACVLVSIGLLGHFRDGFVEGLSPRRMKALLYPMSSVKAEYRQGTCFLDLNQTVAGFSRECLAEQASDSTTVWGDSHAAALSVGLRALLPQVTQYTASGCPPVLESFDGAPPHCHRINEFVLKEIARVEPYAVFLHANWVTYKSIGIVAKVEATIDDIQRVAPRAKVTIVGSVPQWQPSLPTILLVSDIDAYSVDFVDTPVLPELRAIDDTLKLMAARKAVAFVSPLDMFCSEHKCQATINSTLGTSLTVWDDQHLTAAGSRLLAERLVVR